MKQFYVKFLSVVSMALFILMFSCVTTKKVFTDVASLEGLSEIRMNLEIEGESIILSVETADPVTLRAFLMQGLSLKIPVHEISDTMRIAFPSAQDVSERVMRHPSEVKATLKNDKEKRPDIRPLVAALSDTTVCVEVGNQKCFTRYYKIELEASSGTIRYEVSLPTTLLPTADIEVLLISQPDYEMIKRGEVSLREVRKPDKGQQRAPFGSEDSKIDSDTYRCIEIHFNLRKTGVFVHSETTTFHKK